MGKQTTDVDNKVQSLLSWCLIPLSSRYLSIVDRIKLLIFLMRLLECSQADHLSLFKKYRHFKSTTGDDRLIALKWFINKPGNEG